MNIASTQNQRESWKIGRAGEPFIPIQIQDDQHKPSRFMDPERRAMIWSDQWERSNRGDLGKKDDQG
jgi:hypothetical protein